MDETEEGKEPTHPDTGIPAGGIAPLIIIRSFHHRHNTSSVKRTAVLAEST